MAPEMRKLLLYAPAVWTFGFGNEPIGLMLHRPVAQVLGKSN